MNLRHFLLAVAGMAAFSFPAPAQAQVTAPKYRDQAGQMQGAQGTLCLTSAGTECSFGSGAVAAGGANTGNPIKIGCAYNATLPTYVTGQVADAQCTQRGGLIATLYSASGTPFTANAYNGDALAATSILGIAVLSYGSVWDPVNAVAQRARGDQTGAWVVGGKFATVTDGSGTIATGGTSQQVFAVTTSRAYLMCQNPIAATETLFVNIGAAASMTGGSYELAAGSWLTFETNFIPTGAVNVVGATSAHRYVCKQG